ncbi:DUF3617 domain-containing protein [Sphingomonas alpina]|uniref:DUF3617 domain-containing protein n=1 Tax=Sphingomonas alpina TaxID=653931 RepID=A0A7H0LDQ9_9SPHN|nr:DUF3617 domain-containing protein [Sphingomonas alpina]QNQ07812.1 DUF3617 domain-containing protein [Sphingomonas alpina]
MTRLLACLPLALLIGAAPGSHMQPGKWETRIEIIDVKMPGGPPGVAAAMKGKPKIVTACVTPEQAAQGPRAVTKADPGCKFTRYSMTNGRISSQLVCSRPRGTVTMTSEGSYTPTSYTAVGRGVMSGKAPMTITTRTSGRRIGPC